MAGKFAGYIFTVVVPVVVAAMIPHVGPEIGFPIILVSVVVGLCDFAWMYSKSRHGKVKVSLIVVMGVGALLLGGGAIAFFLSPSGKGTESAHGHHQTPKTASLTAQAKAPTLFTLFMTDLKPTNGIRWDAFSDFTYSDEKTPVTVRIFYTIISDLNANASFVTFYIPAIFNKLEPNKRYSYIIAEKLAADYPRLLDDVRKKHWAEAKFLGDASAISTRDFSFSGRIYIYHADNFSVTELAALTDEFKKMGATVQFRSMDYAMAAWDSIQLGRIKSPPEYEIRNGLPVLAEAPLQVP
jgi:hypothetical protein